MKYGCCTMENTIESSVDVVVVISHHIVVIIYIFIYQYYKCIYMYITYIPLVWIWKDRSASKTTLIRWWFGAGRRPFRLPHSFILLAHCCSSASIDHNTPIIPQLAIPKIALHDIHGLIPSFCQP
jgi:hypothetical protein